MDERELIVNKVLMISSMDKECLRRMKPEALKELYKKLEENNKINY